jgi:hypothetical protein
MRVELANGFPSTTTKIIITTQALRNTQASIYTLSTQLTHCLASPPRVQSLISFLNPSTIEGMNSLAPSVCCKPYLQYIFLFQTQPGLNMYILTT